MTDVPSVIQTIRLFTMFFSTDSDKQIFLTFLKCKNNVDESDEQDAESLINWSGLILENFLFILEQSLNPILLDAAISFLLNLLDSDDELLISITITERLVDAICNASLTRLKLERTQKTFNHCQFSTNTASNIAVAAGCLNDQTPTQATSRFHDNTLLVTQLSEEDISSIDHLLNKYFLCLQTISTCEVGVSSLQLEFESVIQLFNEYLTKCLVTFNDWEIRSADSLKTSIGEESLQNLTCLLSIINCEFSNQCKASLDAPLCEFLIKLFTFCKYYLKLFNERRNSKSVTVPASSFELIRTNLQEISGNIKSVGCINNAYLVSLINECDFLLVQN